MTGLGPLGASVTLSPPVHSEAVSWGFSLHCLTPPLEKKFDAKKVPKNEK